MFKLPPFAARFFNGFNTPPFAALEQPVVDFAAPTVMQPVQNIYRYDKSGWRTRHLPLVVGWLRPEIMTTLTGKAEDPEIMLFGKLRRADFAHCAKEVARHVETSEGSQELRTAVMQSPAPQLWASVMHAIVKQDEAWFGRPTQIDFVLHRETMRPPAGADEGHGRYKYAGILHRDLASEPNGNVSLLYTVRSAQSMRMLPNRLTDGMPNDERGFIRDEATVKFLTENSVSPVSGAIVLMNGGDKFGTVHSSTQPSRATPSFFAAISCTL